MNIRSSNETLKIWSGSFLSKRCGLGPVGFPRQDTPALPEGRFPFMLILMALPLIRLDYHLVHTIIPKKPHIVNSLGVFLSSP